MNSAAVAILIALVVLGLIALWLTARLVIRILRKVFVGSDLFGNSLSTRVMALGATALMFPKAVAAPFYVVFVPIYTLISQAPSLANSWDQLMRESGASASSSTTHFLLDLSGLFARAFSAIMQELPIADLCIAIATWALLGKILSISEANIGQTNNLLQFFQQLERPQRQKLLLLIPVIFGLYLSIAAIASIPWLRETETPIDTDLIRLKAKVHDAQLSKDDSSNQIPEKEPPSYNEFKTFFSVEFSKRTSTTPPRPDSDSSTNRSPQQEVSINGTPSWDVTLIKQIQTQYAEILENELNSRQARLDIWKYLVRQTFLDQAKIERTVINAFEGTQAGRKGIHERAEYFSELDYWHRNRNSSGG